jgi:chemotaxis receptor (MCP) glutamine deamidase CheD
MKIPQEVYKDFYSFDKDRSGTIDQSEIDAWKGTGTVFDTEKYSFYKVSDTMDISLFIKENRSRYGAIVQYTNNEYTEGRKILQKKQLVPTDKNRNNCEDNSNSIQVEQGEFALKTYSKNTPSLQTYNVCNCVAVTIYDKKTKIGFLTHIDTIERADSLEKILKNCNFNPKTSEVRIIGGQTDCSEGVIELIDETIKNFNLKVVEYDVLGKPMECRRDIMLDLKTGEVFNYKESNPTYNVAYDDESDGSYLMPNKLSDKTK